MAPHSEPSAHQPFQRPQDVTASVQACNELLRKLSEAPELSQVCDILLYPVLGIIFGLAPQIRVDSADSTAPAPPSSVGAALHSKALQCFDRVLPMERTTGLLL